jgi:hypothetical protein
MKIASFCIACIITLCFAIPVQCEDGERHVSGTVVARSGDSISIVVGEKKNTETFAITRETVFLRGREKATSSDVATGELAVIHAKNGIALMVATRPHR